MLQIERLREVCSAGAGALGVLISALAVPPHNEAEAQSDYFYLDRAQISRRSDDGFMVWRPEDVRASRRFYGQAALGYTQNRCATRP